MDLVIDNLNAIPKILIRYVYFYMKKRWTLDKTKKKKYVNKI